jgi:predicted dehydrogenase
VQDKGDVIRFVAVQTRSTDKVATFCQERGIEILPDFDSVLARNDIDAVFIGTPDSLHPKQVEKVARCGKHVFVEKPLARSVRDALPAIQAVQKAQVTLGIGFQRRFYPTYHEVQARIADGRLGAVGGLVAEQTGFIGLFLPASSWRAKEEDTSAGAMAAIGIHLIDLMIGIAGRVRQVDCLVERRAAHVDDTSSALLSFESGATGQIFCSLASANYSRFAVYGSRSLAELTGFGGETLRFYPVPEVPPPPGIHAVPEPEVMTEKFDALAATTLAFARSATEGRPFPIPPEEVLHGVAVYEAILESSRLRRAVTVSGG